MIYVGELSYGIREELLDLVRDQRDWKSKSKILFKHGIQNLDDLAKIPVNKLAEIDKIGSTLADNIKSELRRVR